MTLNFFFYYFIFYFFGNALVQVWHKRYPERIFFFFSFSAYPGPVLLEMPERRFLKFFYFFFFELLWECSNLGWAETVPRMIFIFYFSDNPGLV